MSNETTTRENDKSLTLINAFVQIQNNEKDRNMNKGESKDTDKYSGFQVISLLLS